MLPERRLPLYGGGTPLLWFTNRRQDDTTVPPLGVPCRPVALEREVVVPQEFKRGGFGLAPPALNRSLVTSQSVRDLLLCERRFVGADVRDPVAEVLLCR